MSIFRRLSIRGLAALFAVAAGCAVAATVAVTAFGGGGSSPPPEPLSQAMHDALSAAPVDGVTARITFKDNLFPSSSLGSLGGGSSPLLSGASGRLWLTNDGHLRLELQSDAGDAQIVSDGTTLTVYDGSSNTAYRLALPAQTAPSTTDHGSPSIPQIDSALTRLAGFADVTGATPDSVAGQPAYTVGISPKDAGGLLDSGSLSWDAATGIPLRFAVYAKGDKTPVLELTATDIGYGPVAASDVDIAPPAGAKVETLTLPSGTTGSDANQQTAPVTGLAAVAAAVPFKLVAPDSLGGLARSEVRLVGSTGDEGALVTYGEGLGTVVVSERAAVAKSAGGSNPIDALPEVSVNGAKGHELVTALGTAVQYTSGGVTYTVAGSITQADAEAAARALTA